MHERDVQYSTGRRWNDQSVRTSGRSGAELNDAQPVLSRFIMRHAGTRQNYCALPNTHLGSTTDGEEEEAGI